VNPHLRACVALVLRDLRSAARRPGDVATPLFFFVVVSALFPLAIGPELGTLRLIGPGIVWVGALLSSILAMHRLFAADVADGSLEQLALSPTPLGLLVAAKVLAHWLLTGAPLVLVAPLIAVQFDLSFDATLVLMLVLLLGTPVLSLIGAVGAALTMGLRGAELLLCLLVLPLYIPVLVFGAGAVQAQLGGLGAQAHVSVLLAMLTGAVFLCPWAGSAALRIALE
jgi:heme exporter protein B